MLTYSFENIGSDSLYEYLYKCIKKDIIEGRIGANEKLPSKRSFAKNLGISVITVEGAYDQLMAEGYIFSIPKKGFYVSELTEPGGVKSVERTNSDIKGNVPEKKYLADFQNNQMESNVFPFTIWAKTIREILNDNKEELMINPPCGGIMSLRKAIAIYLEEFRGMHVKAEQIIIGAGTEYLYGLLIQLLGNEYVYGVENPGYPKVGVIFEMMHADCRYINMDDSGVQTDELEKNKVDIIHISPSHHFPTGKTMPVSRRYELLAWAAGNDNRYIIEDDYDSELRLTGKPIPTLQSIDVSGKVIYMNTFTKTLASTVRISYMVLPEPLLKKFYEKLSFYSCTVSNFEQYTLARFIENGSFEKHINRLRSYYLNKKDTILQKIKSGNLGKMVKISGEEAGIHFLMKIESRKSEEEIKADAGTEGIRLVPLSEYYYGRKCESDKTFVMNYSSLPIEKIDEIIDKIYKIVI